MVIKKVGDYIIRRCVKEDLDQVISINLKGVFLFTKFVVPYMIKQRSGVIINVASELAKMGLPFRHAYA
ncbi:MAG: SDR family oxidoreductase, partial [Nitrososphaerales archaeon]